MFHRIMWFKRARCTWGRQKNMHGVKRIERLMQEIRSKTPVQLTETPLQHLFADKYKIIPFNTRLDRLKKERQRLKRYEKQLSRENALAKTAKAKRSWLKRWKKFKSRCKQNNMQLQALTPLPQIIRMEHDPKKVRSCVYCNRPFHRVTCIPSNEHLLPRSVGGTLVVRACRSCNMTRGVSGNYRPFLRFIESHKDHWYAAIANTTDMPRTLSWLHSWNLTPFCSVAKVV